MNTRNESATYIVSRNRGIPRGADWAADIAVSIGKLASLAFSPLRKSLEASARARARSEILDLADTYERTQPTFAAELRAASAFADRDIDGKA